MTTESEKELLELVDEYDTKWREAEREIAELKERLNAIESGIDVCWQGDMDRTIKQNLELKAQIEKMKCCSNCRHLALKFRIDWCMKNDTNLFECDLSKDWELKE